MTGGAKVKFTSSTNTWSDPFVSSESFAYSHCNTDGPSSSVKVFCAQLWLPESCACRTPLMEKFRKSAFACVDAFHQNFNVPGPTTVVRIHVEFPAGVNPLRTHWLPS